MLTPPEIYEKTCVLSQSKVSYRPLPLFLLSCLAGMFIAFGALLYILVASDPTLGFAPQKLLGGLAFTTGLYLVITAGSELFTGNCMAILGVFTGRIHASRLIEMLVMVWFGNFIGSLAVVVLVHLSGVANAGLIGSTAVALATIKVNLTPMQLLARSILCNILVCLAVWCSYSATTVSGKLLSIVLPITAFVALGFEHSVANMFFLPFGLVCQASGFDLTLAPLATTVPVLTIGKVFFNIAIVTLGNTIAAFVFVAGVYHLIYRQQSQS